MTPAQIALIGWLADRGYDVHEWRRTAFGHIILTVRRKLTAGTFELSVSPDGIYQPPNHRNDLQPLAKV